MVQTNVALPALRATAASNLVGIASSVLALPAKAADPIGPETMALAQRVTDLIVHEEKTPGATAPARSALALIVPVPIGPILIDPGAKAPGITPQKTAAQVAMLHVRKAVAHSAPRVDAHATMMLRGITIAPHRAQNLKAPGLTFTTMRSRPFRLPQIPLTVSNFAT